MMAILPEHHHEGDRAWLKEQFSNLAQLSGTRQAESVADKYSAAYLVAHQEEPIPQKKDGAARREANTRLRQVIKNLRGKVYAPPTE